jgi:hypothetical protein
MSCGSLKNTPDTNFSILYASEFGGAEKSGFLLIENNESYIKFIESLKLDEADYANFLKVDFKKKKCNSIISRSKKFRRLCYYYCIGFQ